MQSQCCSDDALSKLRTQTFNCMFLYRRRLQTRGNEAPQNQTQNVLHLEMMGRSDCTCVCKSERFHWGERQMPNLKLVFDKHFYYFRGPEVKGLSILRFSCLQFSNLQISEEKAKMSKLFLVTNELFLVWY